LHCSGRIGCLNQTSFSSLSRRGGKHSKKCFAGEAFTQFYRTKSKKNPGKKDPGF
jgi:hypothetical protein